MTPCVQNLPSLLIPTSPCQPKFYRKKPPSFTKETKEEFRVTVSQFSKKFPALTSLYSSDSPNTRQITDHSNLWSYGTPYLVKLLFTGNLPKTFYDEIIKACEATKVKTKKKASTDDKDSQKTSDTRQIWLPKDKIKLRESGRRVEQRILEARLRHKENLEVVSMRAEKLRNRTEVIRLKKAGQMERGKRICLERMQRPQIRPGRLIKRQCNSPLVKNQVFELTQPLPCY